jgi:hypothetical protein
MRRRVVPWLASALMASSTVSPLTYPLAGPALDSAPFSARFSLLMHADDTAVLATSAEELQQLLALAPAGVCARCLEILELALILCRSVHSLPEGSAGSGTALTSP